MYEIIDDLGFNSYLVKQSIAPNQVFPFEVTLTQNTDDKGVTSYQFGRLTPSLTDQLITKDVLDSSSDNYVVGNSDNLQQEMDKQFEFIKKFVEADYASLPKLKQESDELLAKLNLADKKVNEYWQSLSIEGQSFQGEFDFYDYFESQNVLAMLEINNKFYDLMKQYDQEHYNIRRNQIFEQVQSYDEQYYEELDAQRAEVEASYQNSLEDELNASLDKIDEEMNPYVDEYEKLSDAYSEANDAYYLKLEEINQIDSAYLHLEETKQSLIDLIASHGFSISK